MLFLGTAKYNPSQVKWASQGALQWLPDTDMFSACHTAGQEAKGGEFKDLGMLLAIWMFQIPVA